MPRLKKLTRKPALWLGFFSVFAPLAVLLALQYRWLVSLEESSAIAERATLENYLEAVTSEIRYHYASMAERALNVPASFFRGGLDVDALERQLRLRPVSGVAWLFVVYPGPDSTARAVFFDPQKRSWGEPAAEQVSAVHVATAPWVMLSQQRTMLASWGLQVDEHEGAARIILNPVVDRDRHVVGVVGMILDPEDFRRRVLPAAIEQSLPDFFGETAPTHFMVRVQDAGGALRYATAQCPAGEVNASSLMAATRPFSFVFQDWGVAVQGHGVTAEEWARNNFLLNLSLSALLGVVLVGGAVFTLRTAAREVRLSQMKSDFVSNVSHELRTPLASIQAFGELLRRGRARESDRVRQYGEYIETESRRLGRLIGNLLDFSRIENGERRYDFARLDLGREVEEVLSTFSIRAREAAFEISFEDRSGGRELPILADREAIAQALTNLLDNAMKFSGASRRIEVWSAAGERYAEVGVRDFGVGISEEETARIFERFHRVGSGVQRRVGGCGLGLSIVQHIVDAHLGEIDVRSAPGRGSTFVLRLPLLVDPADMERGIES